MVYIIYLFLLYFQPKHCSNTLLLTMCVYVLYQPLQEKYAQLAFESGGNRMPSLEALEQPVQYSKVNSSTKTHPQHDLHEPRDTTSQSAVNDPRHPLGGWTYSIVLEKQCVSMSLCASDNTALIIMCI